MSYFLTIEKEEGANVTVERISSPTGGADTGFLEDGAVIYADDKLHVIVNTDPQYAIELIETWGFAEMGDTILPVDAVLTVTNHAWVRAYTTPASWRVVIAENPHVDVEVERISSPFAGATSGVVNDDYVYYDDVLLVKATPKDGYLIEELTVNGTAVASGDSYTVTGGGTGYYTGKILVKVTTIGGLASIGDGKGYAKYLVYIGNGKSYDQYMPYADDGKGWNLCS